jgi:hypothetical protein
MILFVRVIHDSFFAHGMWYRTGLTLTPLWSVVRLLALLSATLPCILVILWLRARRAPERSRISTSIVLVAGVLFLPWLGYWQLLG